MAMSDTSSNSANLWLYYNKKLLTTLQPRLQLYKLGKKAPLPKGYGTQAKWLIYTRPTASTSALTEGTNPSEISFTTANVTKTVAQYGQFIKVSDMLQDTAIDPVMENLAELLGRCGAESIEALIVAELDAALTVRYVNDVGAVNSVTAGDTFQFKEFLKAQVAMRRDSLVGPHEMGDYMAVLHPSVEYDIRSEANIGGWLDLRSYAAQDQSGVMKGEIGKVHGLRFLVSDKMSAADNSGSINVKNCYVLGEECFGVVELEKGVSIIKKDGKDDTSNPLSMFSTVGYKIHGFGVKNFAAGRGRIIKGASSLA